MTVIQENQALKGCHYFSLLNEAEATVIQENSYCRAYKKGQVLFDAGDERNRMFILKKGLVKFEKIDQSGTLFYLNFVKDKAVFPLTGLFTDENYHFSAIAMTDIEVCYISRKIFEKVIQGNNQQLLFYFNQISLTLKKHVLKIESCVTSSASQRVKNTLAILMHDLGEKNYFNQVVIPYPILMNDISHSSGTTRETASLVIKKLVKKKKIQYLHKELIFFDPAYFSLDYD
ncbi:Crp/Fnr family transcriptional regulator [Enterococcus rotai]|uniref:Crp/Fnr family transcriptional regulator n=1 Tax=Enterococcus rotai TaxID=118060 RepID=UPI0032B575F4